MAPRPPHRPSGDGAAGGNPSHPEILPADLLIQNEDPYLGEDFQDSEDEEDIPADISVSYSKIHGEITPAFDEYKNMSFDETESQDKNVVMARLVRAGNALVSLSVVGASYGDEIVNRLIRSCREVTRLSLVGCNFDNNHYVRQIPNYLTKLELLDLRESYTELNLCLGRCCRSKVIFGKNFATLDITRSNLIDKKFIKQLIKAQCPLFNLYISHVDTVPVKTLASLVYSRRYELSVFGNGKHGVSSNRIFKALSFCARLDGYIEEAPEEMHISTFKEIMKLEKLKLLNLDCSRLPIPTLIEVLGVKESFPILTKLVLMNCAFNSSEDNFVTLIKGLFPNMETLVLHLCPNITDDDVNTLVESYTSLKDLTLCSSKITHAALRSCFQGNRLPLTRIVVTQCPSLDVPALLAEMKHMPDCKLVVDRQIGQGSTQMLEKTIRELCIIYNV